MDWERELFPVEVYIEQSNEIEGYYNNPVALESSIEAWEYLVDQEKLSHEVIKKVQGQITSWQKELPAVLKGEYRNCDVWVGGKKGPSPMVVHNIMEDWLEKYASKDPLDNHILFEYGHVFGDGNGRTGRMLYWWQCLKNGVSPILFTSDKRFEYYKLFN